jgi:iron complex transport system substrate-binding protein
MLQTIMSLLLLGASVSLGALAAGIELTDDAGRVVRLERPAQRVVSLAPHITENLFSAGVGDRIVGTVNYSDYPQAARAIRQVGGYDNVNIELIHALKPDLIVVWEEGNQKVQYDQLQALGHTIYVDYPRDFEGIARSIRNFGILTGNATVADAAAASLLDSMRGLRERFGARTPVSVFYQVWPEPLITVNDRQIIGQSIRLCGGRNVFAQLDSLSPSVGREDVIAADPQVIIASGMNEQRPQWLDEWARWPKLQAVRDKHLFFIPPDIIQRHTARLLEGTTLLCEQLEQVRREEAAAGERR